MITQTNKKKYRTIEDYRASLSKEQKKVLDDVRALLRDVVPDVQEAIHCQIPAFKSNGAILYFAAFEHHFTIAFPPPLDVFDIFKEELVGYEKTKAAIRFPYTKKFPRELIRRMVLYRAKENAARKLKKIPQPTSYGRGTSTQKYISSVR